MAAAFAFTGIYLMSLLVALLAALQLGDFFNAGGEFGLVIAVVAVFTIAAFLVLASVYTTGRAGVLALVALILAICALTLILLPGVIWHMADRSVDPFMLMPQNLSVMLELAVPSLLAVLVQWGLIRRRLAQESGFDELTRWPWITTIVAGFTVLNPLALAYLDTTLRHSQADAQWQITATVTAGILLALLVMAWIECYIRDRMLNRRSASMPETNPKPVNGAVSPAG